MNSDTSFDQFVITRKRKKYKFAVFNSLDNCYNDDNLAELQQILTNSNTPLTVEIGAGSALFLTKLAELHPDRHYLAIDRKSDRLYHGAKLAKQLGLTNINYLWSNARNINTIIADGAVDELWITFPDPWPQESNIKHRLTNPKYLAQYQRILAKDGKLNFKTDNQPLFDWSVEQFDNTWHITHQTHDLHNDAEINQFNTDATIMTSYEERYTAEGKPICYLQAIKSAAK